MRVIELYAPKGGQGVTTTAVALATVASHQERVHLDGHDHEDLAAVLGVSLDPGQDRVPDFVEITERLSYGDTTPDDATLRIFDAGTTPTQDAALSEPKLRYLVVRPCFLALRRAIELPVRPHGIILLNEPGRALGARDIETTVGVPVTIEIDLDPQVARAVDAGLLSYRVPRALTTRLTRLLTWHSVPDRDDALDAARDMTEAQLADAWDHRHAPR